MLCCIFFFFFIMLLFFVGVFLTLFCATRRTMLILIDYTCLDSGDDFGSEFLLKDAAMSEHGTVIETLQETTRHTNTQTRT